MQPNKIETDFKNKLNEREIKPTQQAWDRLDAMLAVAEEKKSKRKFPWLFIAASITVFLFVGVAFFTQNNKTIDVKNNEVVIENNKSIEKEAIKKEEMPLKFDTPIVQKEVVNVNLKSKKRVEIPVIKENKTNNNENPIVENPIINQKAEQELITPKITEVAIVELPVKSEKALAKPMIKVDANSLLSQVDGELDLTFREKVLQTVGKNYKTVKVALSNRNQE